MNLSLQGRSYIALLALTSLAFISFTFLMPRQAHAAAVSVTALTATSTPAYTNTGLATTTRAKTGDTVQFQISLSGSPLIAPQINIFNMGSTTMSGSGANYYYATTTTAVWTEGPITFRIGAGGTAGDATTTPTQANLTGTNVTYDKTGPSLSSVAYSDADGSTEFSATDTLTFTFNETMATTTIASGNADARLGLSGSHSFGTSPTVSWNTAGTILTLTLGTSPTLATGDTVDPSSSVFDAIGNADATAAPLTVTDNVAPSAPTGISNDNFGSARPITLTSTGATLIRYTLDGTTPTCSSGTVYSGLFVISETTTINAVGCDAASNASSVTTATYTKSSSGGGGGHRSSRSSNGSSTSAAQVSSTPAAIVASANAAFKRDLTVGGKGDDVKALQVWLNSKGFMIAASGPGSKGMETSTFGGLTRAALAKFQKSVGITPASGYLGPKTRAYLASH